MQQPVEQSIEQLANRLGVTAQHVVDTLTHRAILDGTLSLGVTLVLIYAIDRLVRAAKRNLRGDSDDASLGIIYFACAAILAVSCIPMIYSAITSLLMPESEALKIIFGK